jgi:hypothetical protein
MYHQLFVVGAYNIWFRHLKQKLQNTLITTVKNFPVVGISRSDTSPQMGLYMSEEKKSEKEQEQPKQLSQSLSGFVRQQTRPTSEVEPLEPNSAELQFGNVADPESLESNKVLMIPKRMVSSLRKFLHENPDVLYRFLLRKISEGITQQLQEVKLFYLGSTETLATIRYDDYDRVLDDAMKHFVTTEQYELADQCKTAITTYSIEKLINSSKI